MDRPVAPRGPLIELVGPAGAGKSTILRLLETRNGLIGRGVWNLPPALLLRSAIRTLPSCLDLWARARAPAWEETKYIVRLEALFRLLHDPHPRNQRTWLLDEGPVYVFAWLRVVGREAARPPRFAPWWREAVARWRAAIGVVVLLDAPNPVLVERIRSRAKPHPLKAWSDAAAVRFLDDYRTAFAQTIADLRHANGAAPAVIQLRTDTATPEAVATDLVARLNGRLDAR